MDKNNRVNSSKSDIAAADCATPSATDLNAMSLEQRIVACLADHTVEASYLAELTAETEKAIADADTIAMRLQQVALDPAESPDAAQAREAAEFAGFVVKRLRSVLPRLQQCHDRVTARERATRWNAAADRIQAKRDALAADFTNLYPQIINGLLDFFKQVRDMDAEVDLINGAAPNSEGRRISPVASQGLIQQAIANTRLVDVTARPVWPPPQPQILPEQIMTVPTHAGANWHQANQQRAAERHAEAQRVANFYATQARQREEREAAEARAAREAHLRNGGTP